MISAMSSVAVRRGRKRRKSLNRFNFPSSHHSSNSSLSGKNNRGSQRRGQSISTISGHPGQRAFQRRHLIPDSELERQRRRFLVYMGTLFLITGLLLVFIGVGAAVPTAQTVGLLLIGVGAVLCIIKVFCSEAHMTDVPPKVVIVEDPESNSGGNNAKKEEATPLANISEFTELPGSESGAQDANAHQQQNNVTPTSPPNSIPETQVLIGNDSAGGRY